MVNSTSRMPPRPVLTSRVASPGAARLLLDRALERLDLVDLGEAEVFAIDERLDGLEELPAELEVAGDGADLDQRLPLPGAAQRVVVGQRAGQGPGERAALALGPQAQVDAVGLAAVGVADSRRTTSADHAAEELAFRASVSRGPRGLALLVVDEHQVDVAGVVQLLAAELAEGEDDHRPGWPLATGWPKRRLTVRRAVARATSGRPRRP